MNFVWVIFYTNDSLVLKYVETAAAMDPMTKVASRYGLQAAAAKEMPLTWLHTKAAKGNPTHVSTK